MEHILDSAVVKNSIRLAARRFISAFVIIGLILFIPAGTLKYWNAWLFLATLFIPVLLLLSYLLKNDPALLEKRMRTGEKRKAQRLVIKLSVIPFAIAFLIPGFDFRYGWSDVPLWLVIASAAVFLLGYFIFFLVIKENSFASRVVEIQEKQKLIDTGMYAVVRHPMYLSNVLIFLSMPLILGSYYSLIPMCMYAFVFYIRVKDEEELLIHELEGYTDYVKKVKYRIIPYIW